MANFKVESYVLVVFFFLARYARSHNNRIYISWAVISTLHLEICRDTWHVTKLSWCADKMFHVPTIILTRIGRFRMWKYLKFLARSARSYISFYSVSTFSFITQYEFVMWNKIIILRDTWLDKSALFCMCPPKWKYVPPPLYPLK